MIEQDSASLVSAIETGPIEFTEWVPWCGAGRRRLKKPEPWLGVYVWAHFHRPPGDSRPYPELPKELIYVGETRNLNRRPLSGDSHHRLHHYKAKFPEDPRLERLYVSVYPVEVYRSGGGRSRLLRAYTRYVEDLIYWQYVQRFGERAALDYKKGKTGP